MPNDPHRGPAPAVSLRGRRFAAPLAFVAALLSAAPALADSDEGFDKKGDDAIAADKQASAEKGDKMPGEKDKAAPPTDDKPDPKYDPMEESGKAYRFIGLRFRDVIVPKFMINIFADGGATVNVAMVGPEFTTRKDHFELDFALQYADYSMNPFLFKGKSDGEEAYEIVSSSMKMMLATVDILADVPIDKKGRFSFLAGGSVGLGGVFGKLYRVQAFPVSGNTGDPNKLGDWKPCSGPAATPTTKGGVAYCDSSNNHYGNYDESSWANGGSKPLIFPWISLPQLSFRYKPIKQLQTRFDTGFSTSGFFFGLSASYGL